MNIKGRDTMNLADILKRKLSQPASKEGEKEEDEDIIPYKAVTSYSPPSEDLFLALYTPFIKNPYAFDWFIFREYSEYLLDGTYVLNTFERMDKDYILEIYIQILKPKTFDECAKIIFFVGHICLCVPRLYQQRILEILEKK